MKHALLQRIETSDHGTVGRLVSDALPEPLWTMEPPWRGNQRRISCILPGTYTVIPHRSPRFGKCLLVTETEGRSHILFHSGNLGGDSAKGFKTHTLGCILPGLRAGKLKHKGRLQRAVLSSRTAFRHLMDAATAPFELEIRDVQ